MATRALTHRRIDGSNQPGASGSPSDEMTTPPCVMRFRGDATRSTHVRSSPVSIGAITNQRCRTPRPVRRTRAGPCRPYTASTTSAASMFRSARCSRLAAVRLASSEPWRQAYHDGMQIGTWGQAENLEVLLIETEDDLFRAVGGGPISISRSV